MKHDISRQISQKYSNSKFHENPSSGSRVVPCGRTYGRTQTDRHDEANSRFSQLCERASKKRRHETTVQVGPYSKSLTTLTNVTCKWKPARSVIKFDSEQWRESRNCHSLQAPKHRSLIGTSRQSFYFRRRLSRHPPRCAPYIDPDNCTPNFRRKFP
jgi:hypothetical protein